MTSVAKKCSVHRNRFGQLLGSCVCLPDPLQTKWRRSVKLYRDKTGGREPSLRELSAFITAESQTENDPVYGRLSNPDTRVGSGFRPKKTPSWKPGNGPPITTMATEVQTEQIGGTDQQRKEASFPVARNMGDKA